MLYYYTGNSMSDVTDSCGNSMSEKSDHENDNDETCSENDALTIGINSTMNVITTQEGMLNCMCAPMYTQVMMLVIFIHACINYPSHLIVSLHNYIRYSSI